MKLATWNVNSIRARTERVMAWLTEHQPDVVCLQETKITDDRFPALELRALGYEAAVVGQRTYNGVAILSRAPLEDVERDFGDGADDPQARFVAATVRGIRVMCAYFPNGGAVGSDKFQYKLEWMGRLTAYLARNVPAETPAILCGDFNVAPEPIDVHDPAAWEGQTLFTRDERDALARIRDASGFVDLWRHLHPEEQAFSWWDYRMLAFPKNRGLRIDHIYATAPVAKQARSAWIDRDTRKGKQPSDHAAVCCELAWGK